MNTALTTQQGPSLVKKFATRFGVDSDKLLGTLKATAFKQTGDKEVSNEQMMALLIVADQYGLNPFTKEIFAFDDRHKGIVPVVSVDGWARIINEHSQLDGIAFRYSETMTTPTDGKPCPEWCESVITRKDRAQPIVVREYLDEVYQGKRNGFNGPWQTHTKRMLRHKTLIQGSRIAFGFAGIHDEDEAVRIIEGESTRVPTKPSKGIEAFAESFRRDQPALEHQPTVDMDLATGEVQVHDHKTVLAALHLASNLDELEEAAIVIPLLPEGAGKLEAHQRYIGRLADFNT